MKSYQNSITIALSWCMAWGEERTSNVDIAVLHEIREALITGGKVPDQVREIVEQSKKLLSIDQDYFPETLEQLKSGYPDLWNQNTPIGLVYGGPTKIQQYVFESSKIQDVRGASALLDRINTYDIPAFFKAQKSVSISISIAQWLKEHDFSDLAAALIPELIIYSTGGNILAFCPAAYVNDLANAIEKRFTYETLTANSCAVGDKFRLLEIRFGLLNQSLEHTNWLDWYRKEYENPLVQAYFGYPKTDDQILEAFKNRKSFNEITTKLAILFNQRRSGKDFSGRPSRRYPPMFETHPYLKRDDNERRSTVVTVNPPELPKESSFSEASARKHLVGYRAKKGSPKLPEWYEKSCLEWRRESIDNGWVDKFNSFLDANPSLRQKYYAGINHEQVEIAQNLSHIANASKGFLAYIYADGNNMGGYIQKEIQTPQQYKDFSNDVGLATEYAVYQAIVENLHPHKLRNLKDEESNIKSGLQNGDLVHPFEIITIGGDDVFIIVQANQALAIAKTIGEYFEKFLLKQVPLVEQSPGKEIKEIVADYQIHQSPPSLESLKKWHRYKPTEALDSQCKLSTSIGVLITAYNTPIYYAQDLTEQLLKSAKERAKKLKKAGYYGGTVDFLTLKSVTMISSSISEFRSQALIKKLKPTLKLYATPYTFHELGGLLAAITALKQANFPKSQLYQIRSLLERGKHTAILNYRYFRVRLKQGKSTLKAEFEEAWCQPKDSNNHGNLAPWMYDKGEVEDGNSNYPLYETIWREIVDLYDFIALSDDSDSEAQTAKMEAES